MPLMSVSKSLWSSVLFILLFSVPLTSCSNKDSQETVDLSYFENLHSEGEWAVITEPYVAYRDKPDVTSTVKGHGRLGDISQIIGKALVPDITNNTSIIWYQFSEGFVSENSLIVYPNKFQAQSAASQLNAEQ